MAGNDEEYVQGRLANFLDSLFKLFGLDITDEEFERRFLRKTKHGVDIKLHLKIKTINR